MPEVNTGRVPGISKSTPIAFTKTSKVRADGAEDADRRRLGHRLCYAPV
jgi:hypothetical protein